MRVKGGGLGPRDCLERVMGIEPTLFAWEAEVLPLNYTRVLNYCGAIILNFSLAPVGGLAEVAQF